MFELDGHLPWVLWCFEEKRVSGLVLASLKIELIMPSTSMHEDGDGVGQRRMV
ncbi:hypothetical protein NC652_003670 [Populus alba x Populus x berolinensis]|nr:hypothetical protein NC652_003670 [Populus alba x Populus x berolinensis]